MGYSHDSLVHHVLGDLDITYLLGHDQNMVASLCNLVEGKVDFVHARCCWGPKQEDHLGRMVPVDCHQEMSILVQDIFGF